VRRFPQQLLIFCIPLVATCWAEWEKTQEAIQNSQKDAIVDLHIGVSQSVAAVLFSRIAAALKKAFPYLQYDVAVLNSLQVVKQLEGQHLDLGFIEQPLTLKGAIRTTLCTDQLIAAGWSTGTWITREEGSGMRYYTTAYLQAAGISPQHMMTVNNNAMLLALVQQGVGQALCRIKSHSAMLRHKQLARNFNGILLAAKPNRQLAPQTGHAR
jgi:LysR family transcriptional regulator, transcriptional activator of the cysJI operon